LFQLLHQVVAGLGRVQGPFDGTVAAAPADAAAALQEVVPGVLRQRPQPGPEAPRRVVLEVLQLLGQLEEDDLGDVLGVGRLEGPGATPAVDLAAVVFHELAPGGLVVRAQLQPAEQGDARGRGGIARHTQYSPGGPNLAAIVGDFPSRCNGPFGWVPSPPRTGARGEEGA